MRVVLPGYRDVMAQLKDLEIVGECPALAQLPACSLGRSTTPDGLPIYVLICPTLYERDGNPYCDANGRDWSDNDVRFARLASAAARLAMGEVDPGWRADLVHADDWPSALTPAYLAWRGARIPTILTIHNLAYQGLFSRETLRKIGAPASAFNIEGVEFYGQVSFLKAGLIYALDIEGAGGCSDLAQRLAREQPLIGEIVNCEDGRCGAAPSISGCQGGRPVVGVDEIRPPARIDLAHGEPRTTEARRAKRTSLSPVAPVRVTVRIAVPLVDVGQIRT